MKNRKTIWVIVVLAVSLAVSFSAVSFIRRAGIQTTENTISTRLTQTLIFLGQPSRRSEVQVQCREFSSEIHLMEFGNICEILDSGALELEAQTLGSGHPREWCGADVVTQMSSPRPGTSFQAIGVYDFPNLEIFEGGTISEALSLTFEEAQIGPGEESDQWRYLNSIRIWEAWLSTLNFELHRCENANLLSIDGVYWPGGRLND